jgi:hypothetical protein
MRVRHLRHSPSSNTNHRGDSGRQGRFFLRSCSEPVRFLRKFTVVEETRTTMIVFVEIVFSVSDHPQQEGQGWLDPLSPFVKIYQFIRESSSLDLRCYTCFALSRPIGSSENQSGRSSLGSLWLVALTNRSLTQHSFCGLRNYDLVRRPVGFR